MSSMLALGCSGKKDGESSSSGSPPAVSSESAAAPQKLATPPKSAGPVMAPGPYKIARTALKERLSTTRDGQQLRWQELGQIEVSGEEFRQVYRSRGKSFVSFKAELKAAAHCLVDWRVELIAGPTGRGKSLAQISGLVPTRKGESVTVSGVVAVVDEDLPSLASASAGYWTLCGDELPRPNLQELKIDSALGKQIKFGTAFDIHHTEFKISGKAPDKQRCFFEIVSEDTDKSGFTLNRDFASFSVDSNKESSTALLRRTSLEGGNARDYEKLARGKRSYLRKMYCIGALTPPEAGTKGVTVSELELHPHEGEGGAEIESAEHIARQSYGHSATVHNTSGVDCAFQLRYRILDKTGLPLNRTSIFSETVHLEKGAKHSFRSKTERLFVWRDHVDKVGSLIVESAQPINQCKSFDSNKVMH
ncbi:MAG: hypothetical protein JKY56_22480 [Kofleriaceae bacterium]|nr:hypothetical protein [Kofleriaceae bacterium]